jgi:hypothetical protein
MEKGVLFLHGLESGVYGKKSNFLRKHFKNCIIPDLQVSKFRINLKNCILRLVLVNPLVILIFSTFVLFTYYLYGKFGLLLSIPLGICPLIPILRISKNYLMRNAIKKAVDRNVSVAYEEILKHNPKVIVGSSWGGSIAVNLIERGLWNGNTILIAPAFYRTNKILLNNQEGKIKNFRLTNLKDFNGKIIVFHSKADQVIPFDDSKYLCGIEPNENISDNFKNINEFIEFRSVKNDDHALNSLIEAPIYELKKTIEILLL